MCRSKIEGGWRCYSHTNKSYQKILTHLSRAKEDLDKKNNTMAELSFNLQALSYKYEAGEISRGQYEAEKQKLVEYIDKGKELISSQELYVLKGEEAAKNARAEVQTTAKGLKMLKAEIKEEKDPERKKVLQVEYNVGSRVNGKRQEAWKRYKENKAKADDMRAKANEILENANLITTSGYEQKEIKKEMELEAAKMNADAYVTEHDGRIEVKALFDKHGNPFPAKIIEGKYGPTWAVLADSQNPMSKPKAFISLPRGKSIESRAKYYDEKGLKLVTQWVPGESYIQEDEFGNKKVSLRRLDGGYSPLAVDGSMDFYKDKIKESTQKK